MSSGRTYSGLETPSFPQAIDGTMRATPRSTLVYVATGIPHFAARSFRPSLAWLGSLFAIAALGVFHLTHRALGRNWSISLDVRENHELVTEGIYRKVRHRCIRHFGCGLSPRHCLDCRFRGPGRLRDLVL